MDLRLLFVAFLLVVAAACAKQEKSTEDTPPTVEKRLARYTINTDGESATYHFEYNDQRRLVRYYSHEDLFSMRITYDNRGNAIRFQIESEGVSQDYDINYSPSGVPISAINTLIYSDGSDEEETMNITYEVADGKLKKMKLVDEHGTESTIAFTYTNDNLTKIVNRILHLESTLTLRYGEQSSAYLACRFAYPVVPDLFSNFSSRNEVLEVVSSGMATVKGTYTYVYGAGGYPTSCTEKDEQGHMVSETSFFYQ